MRKKKSYNHTRFRKFYNVEQISIMLDVSKETVRRWIRKKKLCACIGGKQGKENVIYYKSLEDFLKHNKKYNYKYHHNTHIFLAKGDYSESKKLDFIEAKKIFLERIEDLNKEIEECNIYIQMIDENLNNWG